MGTLFTILIGVYIAAKLLSIFEDKEEKPESEKTDSFLDTLEKKLREFEQKAEAPEMESITVEGEPQATEKGGRRMKSYTRPDFEGTSAASTLMQPAHTEESELKLSILEEEIKAPSEPFLPSGAKDRHELLKKGIVLKEILEPKYF